MKKLLLQFFILIIPVSVISQSKTVNHILIIDKTQSMKGFGDGRSHGNIWPQVQGALQNYCGNLNKGDRLTIFTFDANIYGPQIFSINDPAIDVPIARQYIGSVQANGLNTGLKKALTTVLDQWDTTHFYNWMFIFTDGNDNVSPENTFNDISNRFKLIKSKNFDFGYLVTLGTNITDVPTSGDIKVIMNPTNLRPVLDSLNKIEVRKQHVQDSINKSIKYRHEIEAEKKRKCDSVCKYCQDNAGKVIVDDKGYCHCKLPIPLWQKILIILALMILLILVWILWLKKLLFPVFERGEIQIPGNPVAQKFAGYKKIYLGSRPKVSNNLLKSFFIGKEGHLLQEVDFSGEITLDKFKGKRWGILRITSRDIFSSQQGRMYHYNPDTGDGIYILNKDGTEIITFNYLNSQNQKQIL